MRFYSQSTQGFSRLIPLWGQSSTFIIQTVVDSKLELITEMLFRLSNDIEEIETTFSTRFTSLEDIELSSGGDTHNGGKSVTILIFRGRYKCTECGVEEDIPRSAIEIIDIFDEGFGMQEFSCKECKGIMETIEEDKSPGTIHVVSVENPIEDDEDLWF